MELDESVNAEFAELRSRFIRDSLKRLEDIARLLAILGDDPGDHAALESARRKLHGLAGLGATFGLPAVTSVARAAELECNEAMKNVELVPKAVAACTGALDTLREQFDQAGLPPPLPAAIQQPPSSENPVDVILLEDDAIGHILAVGALEKHGLSVRGAFTKADALRLIDERLPQALISDILVPDGTGYEVVEYLRAVPGGKVPPAIITSGLQGFVDKVEAIRSGADAFFEKPLDWIALLRTLYTLLERADEEAPCVLYVAGDLDQSQHIASVLESAGYHLRIVSDPKHLDIDLSSFRPDLVLVDSVLPAMPGRHLARYIRQKQTGSTTPVVILGPPMVDEEIASIRSGADDYLTTPVDPHLLLAFLEARIDRARYLRNLIEHDGLTGLLTHSAFMRRLKIRFDERSRKPERPPTLVFGDLDHFKRVNDTYGHPVGDRVLVALGSLLRKSLRRSDVIARYGGEEFALLLDDLSENEAFRLTDRVRAEFGSLEHLDERGSPFRVTISAGVAPLRDDMSIEQWKVAADKALYAAKHEGRDRVITA